jgi:hypothetical protein
VALESMQNPLIQMVPNLNQKSSLKAAGFFSQKM